MYVKSLWTSPFLIVVTPDLLIDLKPDFPRCTNESLVLVVFAFCFCLITHRHPGMLGNYMRSPQPLLRRKALCKKNMHTRTSESGN